VLVVDQHRHTLDVTQSFLGLVESVSVPKDRALGERTLVVPIWFVGADDDLLDALRGQFVRQLRDGERALGVLRPRHRDHLVVQQLVGDVDPAATHACTASWLSGKRFRRRRSGTGEVRR